MANRLPKRTTTYDMNFLRSANTLIATSTPNSALLFQVFIDEVQQRRNWKFQFAFHNLTMFAEHPQAMCEADISLKGCGANCGETEMESSCTAGTASATYKELQALVTCDEGNLLFYIRCGANTSVSTKKYVNVANLTSITAAYFIHFDIEYYPTCFS